MNIREGSKDDVINEFFYYNFGLNFAFCHSELFRVFSVSNVFSLTYVYVYMVHSTQL